MAVRKIKNSWWIDFRANHIRYRKRSPENSKAGAEAYEAALRGKLARGEGINDSEATQSLTFEEFAWTWFKTYVVPNNKYLEQRAKEYCLKKHLIPFFGKLPLEQITTHHVEKYKAKTLQSGRLKPKSVNNQLAVFSKLMTTAYDWHNLKGKPPKVAWLKCPPPSTDFLSADECTLLLSHAEGTIREMLLTGLRTGMRQGELAGLQWSCIDWENRNLTVRYPRCPRTGKLMSPKSNRERHIPMDADVYEMLFKRRQATGYVFTDGNGDPFPTHNLIRKLRSVRRKTGLRPLRWHMLRHTFASHLAMLGVPLNTVQKLLGHSTISMTMRYSHVAPSTLRAAIDILNPKTRVLTDFGQQAGNLWAATIQHETKNG